MLMPMHSDYVFVRVHWHRHRPQHLCMRTVSGVVRARVSFFINLNSSALLATCTFALRKRHTRRTPECLISKRPKQLTEFD